MIRRLTFVLAHSLCLIILIASFARPIVAQEKDAQKAELVVQTGNADGATFAAFSPDGKYLATGDLFNTKLWNIATGQEVRALKGGGAIFSPDGKTLVTTPTLTLWNWRTGQQLQTVQSAIITALAFSPNGDVLAGVDTSAGMAKITLWNAKSGQQLRVLAGHISMVESVVFSPDGKTLASSSADQTVKLWNWQTGEQLRTINELVFPSDSLQFSPDGKILAGAGIASKISLWDVATGQKLRDLGDNLLPLSLTFCRGGKALAMIANDFRFRQNIPDPNKPFNPQRSLQSSTYIKLIDIVTGQELSRIGFDLKPGSRGLSAFQFSPDEKTLALIRPNDNPILLDAATGQELRTFAGYASQVTATATSVDSLLIASGNADGSIKLWDVQKGRQIRTFKGHDSQIKQVVLSQDNRILASATDEVIKLWEVETGKLSKSLPISDPGTQKQVESVVPEFYRNQPGEIIIGDRKFNVFPGENGKLTLHDPDNFIPAVSLISLNENDWVAITPAGLFDASPGARKLMYYVAGLEPIQLEQMKDAYYVPGLLPKIIKGDPLPQIDLFSSADLFPLAEYQQSGQTSLTVKLTNRGGGIGPVQVLINKKECGGDALPSNFNPHQQSVTLKIDLAGCGLLIPGKQNVVEVVTRNAIGSLNSRGSSRGVEIVGLSGGAAQVSTPQIYAIIAGVSDYTGDNLDLSYAAKDAEDFARAFDVGASKLFGAGNVHLRVLTSNSAKSNLKFSSSDAKIYTATKADFTNAFEEFKKAMSNDIFMVYLAGHGVSLNLSQNRSQTGGDTYLYLTQEATTTRPDVLLDKKARDAMTLSSDEVAELMKRNKALKQVLILDTCAAGAATTSLVGKRDLPPDQIKAIERLQDRIGFFVLMGAAADKASYEATQYGQGLLTYSLLQGMRGARLRQDKFADVNLLFNYAQDTVPGLAKNIGGIQRPILIMPERSAIIGESGSFDIGMFTPIEIAKINKTASPRAFVLRPTLIQVNENYDKLELTPPLRQALREAETSIVLVDADEMIDAIKVSGSYAIKNDDLIVTLRLIRNNAPLGKTLTINGKLTDRKVLIAKIVAAIIQTSFQSSGN